MAKQARKWAAGLNRAAMSLTVTLLGVYAFIAMISSASESRLFDGSIFSLLFFALSLLGLAPAILLHELGHALASVLCGWRVWIITVGPVEVRFAPHIAMYARARIGEDAGGYVLPAPPTPALATRLRSAIITAGGPFVSVVAALACFAIAGPLLEYERGWPRLWGGVAFAFAITNLACAVLTLWPHRDSKGIANDIVKFWTTLTKEHDARRLYWLHVLSIVEHGFSPADWDAPTKRQLRQPDAADTSMGLAAAFLDALAHEDYERASALASTPLPTGRVATVHFYLRAWHEACERGDFAAADTALAASRGTDFLTPWVMQVRELALVGVLAANGEHQWARQRYYEMRQKLRLATPTNAIMLRVAKRAQDGPMGDALFPEDEA